MTVRPPWVPQYNGKYAVIWCDFINQQYWNTNNTVGLSTLFQDANGALFTFNSYGLLTNSPLRMPQGQAQLLNVLSSLQNQGGYTIVVGFNNQLGAIGNGNGVSLNFVKPFFLPQPPTVPVNQFYMAIGNVGSGSQYAYRTVVDIDQTGIYGQTFETGYNLGIPPFSPPIYNVTDFVQHRLTYQPNILRADFGTMLQGADDSTEFVFTANLPVPVGLPSLVPFGEDQAFWMGGQPSGPSSFINVRPIGSVQYFGVFGVVDVSAPSSARIPLPKARYAQNRQLLFYPWNEGCKPCKR